MAEHAPSHDDTIGQCYVAGIIDARAGRQSANPYFEHELQHVAYDSGYRDQIAWQAKAGNVRPE